MLPRNHRLKKDRDIGIVFHDGRFISGQMINLKIWPIDSSRYPKRGYRPDDLKIGFSVSKAVSGSAVARNRVKRQMREAVRLLLKENLIQKGFMMMFLPKDNASKRRFEEIEREIVTVLRRAEAYAL